MGEKKPGRADEEQGADEANAGVSPRVRLLIASRHPVVCEGLRALLEAVGEHPERIETVQSRDELFPELQALLPHVVLLDVPFSDERPAVVGEIKMQFPTVRVLLFSATRWSLEVEEALGEGADGVVLKTAEAPELVHAIRDVAFGRRDTDDTAAPPAGLPRVLSNRETEVLECIARGMSNAEIAFALSISLSTVKAHIEHILQKLGACDRANAVARAFRHGLIA